MNICGTCKGIGAHRAWCDLNPYRPERDENTRESAFREVSLTLRAYEWADIIRQLDHHHTTAAKLAERFDHVNRGKA